MTEMRFKALYKSALLVVAAFALNSCSGLLYYPDHVMYVEQDMMEFKPEDVVLTIPSGGEIHGWYLSTKQKPKGIIVFMHGNAQNRTSHIVDIYWILKEGYNIFAVEYPGYGETDGSPSPKNTVESGVAAIQYASKRTPDLPLIVYGQSLGGTVALRAVIEINHAVPIKLVVVHATFPSYKKVAKKMLARAWFTWPFQWLPNLLFSDEFSPLNKIKLIGPTPLLVMHDPMDPVIPFEMGELVFEQATEPKEFWKLSDSAHAAPFSGLKGRDLRKRFLEKLSSLTQK